MILQSTTVRLPVKLQTSTGTAATGIVVGDVLNSIAQIIKSDGTTASITISGTTWYEISSTQSPGLYHLVVPGSALNLLGPVQYTIYPSATAFNEFVGTEIVYGQMEVIMEQLVL
jgi:hypothetical protein